MEKFYFAYGSNLNVDQMLYRCPNAYAIGTAVLEDHQLLFRGHRDGTCGVLTVEPCKGSSVPIGVWSVTPSDETSLDFYEGYPSFYEKKVLTLPMRPFFDPDTVIDVTGMVYVMTPGHRLALPTDLYYWICAEGYRDFDFDRSFLKTARKKSSGRFRLAQ